MLTVVRTLILLLWACSAAASQEWPQFRGPAGNGLSTATNVPSKWSTSDGVIWKTPIPGRGWSSPVVSAGLVYLTTATGGEDDEPVSLRAISIDLSSGRVLWNEEIFRPAGDDADQMHTKNSLASPTPIVDGDRVYVHFGHMGTAALDLEGQVIWRQRVSYPPMHGNGGSPVLAGALIVFSCDGASDPFVVALDRRTGDERWRTPRNTQARQKFSFATPLVIEVDGEQQIISPGSGFVAGYDPRDGREIWRVAYGEGYSVVPRPVLAHGLVYVCTGYGRPDLLTIDPHAARGDATKEHKKWSYNRGAPLTPSPIVVEDDLFFVSDNGVATCLDATTGKVHRTKRLGGDFSASPVFADGLLYFQNEEGAMFVVRADKDLEVVATNDLGERSLASPAVIDGGILLRTESHLWRIGAVSE